MKPHLTQPIYHAILFTLLTFSHHLSAKETTTIPKSIDTSSAQTMQVPGYFRTQVGAMRVTALFDGNIPLPAPIFKGISTDDVKKRWQVMYDETPDGVQTAVSAYLINTGHQNILVDTGAANCFGSSLGHFLNNLKTAGYQASDIDAILITHLHPDHSCGLVDNDNQTVFKNATVYMDEKEAAYWLSADEAQKAPKNLQPFFPMAQKSITPYQKTGQLKTFKAGENIVEGIQSIAEYGHTPGHVGYLFKSNGQKMLIWGDLVHSYSLQLKNPQIAIEFDQNSAQAIESRLRILSKTASEGTLVGGAHMPFPGLGHIVTEEWGYAWIPSKYSTVE